MSAFDPQCPAPLAPELIQLSHGGGGRSTWSLLHDLIIPALGGDAREASLDAATFAAPLGKLAFTTDASVVKPLFFPGGDLGALAVNGSVNDLACAGARPLAMSLSLVLEEGLSLDVLRRVLRSIGEHARRADVRIVTGDTKVVDRGRGDGIYTSVAAVGAVIAGLDPGPHAMRAGDAVLVSGDVGRHGVAILSVREGLAFDSVIESDCAPLTGLLEALVEARVSPHAMRDPTRGGVAAALNELALDAKLGVSVDEERIPVDEGVRAACEILGLDPLSMACEGRLLAIVAESDAERALAAWRAHPQGQRAALIGRVESSPAGRVTLTTALGTRRTLDFLSGEGLPRIC